MTLAVERDIKQQINLNRSRMNDITGFTNYWKLVILVLHKNIQSTEMSNFFDPNTIVLTGEGLFHSYEPTRNLFDNQPITDCLFD